MPYIENKLLNSLFEKYSKIYKVYIKFQLETKIETDKDFVHFL